MAHDSGSDVFCAGHGPAQKKPWYRNLLLWSCVTTALLLAASFFWSEWVAFRHAFFGYWRMIWWAVLLGFLMGGAIDYFVPHTYISKILAQTRKRTILYAAALGLLASACSHGILALAIAIYKKGASGPAVVTFLLASPWANLPVTLLLVGFFGWRGFLVVGAALCVALITGLIFQFLDARSLIERNPNQVQVADDFSIAKDMQQRFRNYSFDAFCIGRDLNGVMRSFIDLIRMVFFWILLGLVLASLAQSFIPEHFFHRFLGPTFLGLVVTMLIAAVLEVCSEGTSPLAFELYRQTGAFGNAFAFLMGGVVTDITEIGLIWTNLGKKTALWMIAVTLPQVFLIACVMNAVW